MKLLVLFALTALVACDWQAGYLDMPDDTGLWGGVRDDLAWPMVQLSTDTDQVLTQYGGNVMAFTPSPYNYFGFVENEYIDQHRQHRGKRWTVAIGGDFYIAPTGAGTDAATDIMRCLVCFDVKKEDAELKEGHKGIGVCGQTSGDYGYFYDGNFFGTVEAQVSDSF